MFDDNKKIGIGLCLLGMFCLFLGIMLIFDRFLLSIGHLQLGQPSSVGMSQEPNCSDAVKVHDFEGFIGASSSKEEEEDEEVSSFIFIPCLTGEQEKEEAAGSSAMKFSVSLDSQPSP